MKSKGFSIASMFLVLLLCTTCTKDEDFLTPEGESSALKGAKADVKIKPSGDMSGITDYNNFLEAKNCKIENVLTGSYSFLTSSYDIKNNVIRNVGQIGLQLYTNNAGVTYNMPENVFSAIKENNIQMNSLIPDAPAIFGTRMNHVDVYDNEISGTCGVGITAWGGLSDYCEDWSIKNNVFCDLVLTHTNLPAGTTIELNNALNCVVKDNWNQLVGGASAADPSNIIGEGVECDD